jgi:glycosyltransferase involved in cell wall biosynthesis
MVRRVISYYELSENFRNSIASDADQISFSTIGRLRERGLLVAFRAIRLLKAKRMTIAVEDESSRHLAGPLILLAAASGSKQIDVLWPDRTAELISYRKIILWIFRIIGAQISSRLAYRRAQRQVKAFQHGALHPARPPVASRRILYLDANIPVGTTVGGSVAHTRGVIDGFVSSGFDVDHASGKTFSTDLAGARTFKVPFGDFAAFPPELNYYTFNRVFDCHAERFAVARQYAFIYQRMSVHNFTGAALRRKLGIPLILEYNGSEVWAAANWGRKLRLHEMATRAERASLENADLVVTVSKALAEELAAAGVDRDRIVVYPNCIDPKIFDPDRFSRGELLDLRKQLNVPIDARLATFIGTFGAWHGIVFLAKAIRRMIDDDRAWVINRQLHFLLIGDGLKMDEVRALLGEAPYSDFVTLTGAIPQASAASHLGVSDIFLCPHVPNPDGSAFFGSPTKLFEYMAMARPIIAADLDQIGDVLRGIYFGAVDPSDPMAELFTPGDEADFLAALRKLVEDPAGANEMAANARATALAFFTWDHHVATILSRARELNILQ